MKSESETSQKQLELPILSIQSCLTRDLGMRVRDSEIVDRSFVELDSNLHCIKFIEKMKRFCHKKFTSTMYLFKIAVRYLQAKKEAKWPSG